jgi:hypothetical protein
MRETERATKIEEKKKRYSVRDRVILYFEERPSFSLTTQLLLLLLLLFLFFYFCLEQKQNREEGETVG